MNRTRRTFLTGLFFLASLYHSAQAQHDGLRIFDYADGSVFIGKVIEQDQKHVVLYASTGDTIHLNIGQIRKWKMLTDDIVLRQRGKFHYKRGLFASLDLGFHSGAEDGSGQLNIILGYRKNEKTSFGIGSGVHINTITLSGFDIRNDFAPTYVYGRRYFGKGNAGSFIFTKLGYSIPIASPFLDDYTGGFFAQPGIGLHFASRGKIRFTISLSEYVQYTRGRQQNRDAVFNNPLEIDYSIWYTRLILKVGVEFR